MTETIAAGSKKTVKHTCQDCKRTVYLVTLDDGTKVLTDPELMTVIPYEGKPSKITARRSHAEMCMQYQIKLEADRAKAKLRGLKVRK